MAPPCVCVCDNSGGLNARVLACSQRVVTCIACYKQTSLDCRDGHLVSSIDHACPRLAFSPVCSSTLPCHPRCLHLSKAHANKSNKPVRCYAETCRVICTVNVTCAASRAAVTASTSPSCSSRSLIAVRVASSESRREGASINPSARSCFRGVLHLSRAQRTEKRATAAASTGGGAGNASTAGRPPEAWR